MPAALDAPYAAEHLNVLYNLLFCDNPGLYEARLEQPFAYPFDVLLARQPNLAQLRQLAEAPAADPRVKLLACRRLQALGQPTGPQQLLAVLVEVGLEDGLDVLASFEDGSARYFNQAGKLLVWETTTDRQANDLTAALFAAARRIVAQIGPWHEARRPHPARGATRITFLVSDGLYFGEAPTATLFADPLAGPALQQATRLMHYLTTKAEQQPAGQA